MHSGFLINAAIILRSGMLKYINIHSWWMHNIYWLTVLGVWDVTHKCVYMCLHEAFWCFILMFYHLGALLMLKRLLFSELGNSWRSEYLPCELTFTYKPTFPTVFTKPSYSGFLFTCPNHPRTRYQTTRDFHRPHGPREHSSEPSPDLLTLLTWKPW
jgi:hypothetical protein